MEVVDGCILLEPREVRAPERISARTLRDMDKAVENFRQGIASAPIDLGDLEN